MSSIYHLDYNVTIFISGYYHLWLNGIQHGDINPRNLIYDKNEMRGILNDFHLTNSNGTMRRSGWYSSDNMPFMALDFLTETAQNDQLERLYRHDCESFGWALLWIICRYNDGVEIQDPPFDEWGYHNRLEPTI